MKITNKIHRIIYYSKSALHVSGNVFAHHQEHLTVVKPLFTGFISLRVTVLLFLKF